MRKLCMFAAPFVLASALYILLRDTAAALVIAGAAAAVCFALFFLRSGIARRGAICLLGFCVGLLWCAGYEALMLVAPEELPESQCDFEATVLQSPRKTEYGQSVTVDVPLEKGSRKAVIYYSDAELCPEPGDRLSGSGRFSSTMGESESDLYQNAHGVRLRIYANMLRVAQKDAKRSIPILAERFRDKLLAAAESVFPEDTFGFLAALLTGEKQAMSYSQKNQFSIAGIYHCVAVSGMHITILFGMILLLCGANHRAAALIGLPVIWFFIWMTGASASSVRAGIMLTLLLLAPLCSREADTPTSFLTALLLLTMQNPWALESVSLQLSFSSTAGILLFSRRLYDSIAGSESRNRLFRKDHAAAKLLRTMLAALCCSISSTVFSTPFTAFHFRMTSLAYILSNTLLLWMISGIFSAGLLIALLAMLFRPAAVAAGWLLAWPVRWVLLVVRLLAAIPHAALYLNTPYTIAFSVYLYAMEMAIAIWPDKLRKLPPILCGAALLAVCLSLSYADFHRTDFSFTALDVGQGQCLILHDGEDLTVVDCGGVNDQSGEEAARFLQSVGEFSLNRLILTHFDADHANGVCQLLRRQKVEKLYLPDIQADSRIRGQIEDAARQTGTELCYVTEDLRLSIPDGSLCVYAPVSDESDNDAGLCVLASAGKYDMLITGDLTSQAEYRFMSRHELPDVEILVAGHHGAKTSTSQTLLETVRPEAVLISVGKDNTYGHPAFATLERIESIGAEIYRTDRNGTITIRG